MDVDYFACIIYEELSLGVLVFSSILFYYCSGKISNFFDVSIYSLKPSLILEEIMTDD